MGLFFIEMKIIEQNKVTWAWPWRPVAFINGRDLPALPEQRGTSYGEQNYRLCLSALKAKAAIYSFCISLRKVMVGWVYPSRKLEIRDALHVWPWKAKKLLKPLIGCPWHLGFIFHSMKWDGDVSVIHKCWIPAFQKQRPSAARGCTPRAFTSE